MIAVAGGKGGCGKTTTALGIAGELAGPSPVTLVDADVDMPDLHVLTQTPAAPGLDDLATDGRIEQCRHPATEEPGVYLVPAGNGYTAVAPALRRLRAEDGHVIVDTAAGSSTTVSEPIRVADRVVLVSTPTRESLVDTAKTASLARAIGTPILGLVINRSDGSIDPGHLFDCDVLTHVPTVSEEFPHRVTRSSYAPVVRAIRKRNT